MASTPLVPTSPTSPKTGEVSKKIGRFELRRLLEQDPLGLLWRAHDPQSGRDVLLKLPRPGAGPAALWLSPWLKEARKLVRLTHERIVPLLEADIHDQKQAFLVFDAGKGQTLASVLREGSPFKADAAVRLMVDVLDAMTAAHAVGAIHGQISPGHIWVDEGGHGRLFDFGITPGGSALPFASVGHQPSGGRPGYYSPESARGGAVGTGTDVFCAGLVLAEMLAGKPLVEEKDQAKAAFRAANEQLALPTQGLALDDKLRAIVQRALARNPTQRVASAHSLRDELLRWLNTYEETHANAAAGVVTGSGPTTGTDTLDDLLKRMRFKTDFPAMSDAVVRIHRIVSSDRESVATLTNEILKDVALTNKLLRLVNSAVYAQHGRINTVSRAVSLVGFTAIRNLAFSLVLLEHMHDKAHAAMLKQEYLRSLMAGSLAGELCAGTPDAEEAFIGSMFQNLGRMLAEFYLPEEAKKIRGLMSLEASPMTEVAASASVLGLSYELLGLGGAKAWGLPPSLQNYMRLPTGDPPHQPPAEPTLRLRWMAVAANDMADTLLHTDADQLDQQLIAVARRHARSLGMDVQKVSAAIVRARQKLIDLAQVMDLRVKPEDKAAKLLVSPVAPSADAAPANPDDAMSASLKSHELHASEDDAKPDTRSSEPQPDPPTRNAADLLAAGIQDITDAMVEDFKLSDVLRMVLETVYRALGFRRVVFCLRDPKTGVLVGRFGLGEPIAGGASVFKVQLKVGDVPATDFLSAVCIKGADTLLKDATDARLLQRLPNWYRQSVNAPTFLMLPLHVKGAPLGLIYADKAQVGAIAIDDRELSLVRTLRNQAIMALKQSV